MVREARPVIEFNGEARTAVDYARVPLDNGAEAQAAADTFIHLGNTLGKMADAAVASSAARQGQAETAAAVGLPQTEFKASKSAALRPRGEASQQATAYFMGLGYSKVQAAGIVGNLMQESGLNTGAVGDKSIPGASVGIGQWNRERQTALKKFAAAKGTAWQDLGTQLAFVHHELSTSEAGAGMRLRQARTVEEATAAMIGYERPQGWTPANPRGGHGWGNRLAYATQVAGLDLAHSAEAFAPPASADVAEVKREVFVPPPKPLALRPWGTIAGDAYNRAAMEEASWRYQAGLVSELNQAYDDHKDDPAAYAKARDEVAKKYIDQAAQGGPELRSIVERRVVENSNILNNKVMSLAEERADQDRKVAALTAVTAAKDGLDRQAYLIGAAQDGDEQLAALTQQGLNAINAGVASGAIDALEASKQRKALTSGLVTSRIQGVFEALPDATAKQNFTQEMSKAYADPQSPLSKLSLGEFRTLQGALEVQAREARAEADSSSSLERVRFGALLKDDLASVQKTGLGVRVGGKALDVDEVARILGPEKAARWQEERLTARRLYAATAGMEKMTDEQLVARLGEVEPKPGEEGFDEKERVYNLAVKQARQIEQQRRTDPALAVEQSFPMLKDEALRANPQELVKARLQAQSALGIPEQAQAPLTQAEAQRMVEQIGFFHAQFEQDDLAAEKNKPSFIRQGEGGKQAELPPGERNLVTQVASEKLDPLQRAMNVVMLKANETYGENADEVMLQVLRTKGVSKATAVLGLDVLKSLGIGAPRAQPINVQGYERALRLQQAEDAVLGARAQPDDAGGPQNGFFAARTISRSMGQDKKPQPRKATLPNGAAVNALRQNSDPAIIAQFDKKYGDGMAEYYLNAKEAGNSRRYLPDGSLEITYENGFKEIWRRDGSVEGVAP